MLEYYVSYWNYIDNMNYTEELLKHTLQQVIGTLEINISRKRLLSKRKSLQQVIRMKLAISIRITIQKLWRVCRKISD